MGDMREDFDALKADCKQRHDERVMKTPDRVTYAIKQFESHNIEYDLKNVSIGHFHCHRKSDDKLFQFWAGTGKIYGEDNKRGIHAFIQLLEQ